MACSGGSGTWAWPLTDQFPFNYPNAGYGLYCLRCHSSARSEYTFASLSNSQGFPGKPISYPVDDSWKSMLPGSDFHGTPPSWAVLQSPGPPSPEFVNFFNEISAVPVDNVQKLPSETYDRVISSARGPEEFLTSEQCMNCHSGLNGPFGPAMFLQTAHLPMVPIQVTTSRLTVSGDGHPWDSRDATRSSTPRWIASSPLPRLCLPTRPLRS
jgi:hypothetical protein